MKSRSSGGSLGAIVAVDIIFSWPMVDESEVYERLMSEKRKRSKT